MYPYIHPGQACCNTVQCTPSKGRVHHCTVSVSTVFTPSTDMVHHCIPAYTQYWQGVQLYPCIHPVLAGSTIVSLHTPSTGRVYHCIPTYTQYWQGVPLYPFIHPGQAGCNTVQCTPTHLTLAPGPLVVKRHSEAFKPLPGSRQAFFYSSLKGSNPTARCKTLPQSCFVKIFKHTKTTQIKILFWRQQKCFFADKLMQNFNFKRVN